MKDVDRKIDAAEDLLFVSVPSGANSVDENGQIVLISEDDSPVTDPKPVNLVHSLEAAHIALVFLTKSLDGSKNPCRVVASKRAASLRARLVHSALRFT